MDSAKERFTVTLKQSLVGASDAAYLQSLFYDLEFAEKLRCVESQHCPSLCYTCYTCYDMVHDTMLCMVLHCVMYHFIACIACMACIACIVW